MDADGGNQRRLTSNSNKDLFSSWSPDGKRIVFHSDRDGHPDRIPGWFTSEIYVMDADGGNQQNLTNHPSDDRSPSWSPDGQRIVFQSDRDAGGNPHNIEIYVMDADGGNEQRLTENRRNDKSPSWSPDSKRIAFHSFRDGNIEIYVMDTNGGNQRNLTKHGSRDISPEWYTPALAVAFVGKTLTAWGWLKRVDR